MKASPARLAGIGLIALAMIVAACTSTGQPGPTATPVQSAQASSAASPPTAASSVASATGAATGVIFQLIKVDGSSVPFSVGDLQKLALVSIMSDGKPQEGPAVLDVLKAAGVSDFATLTFTGANGSKTMAKVDIKGDVILDFNNRGSVKVVSPTMSKDARITDITKIEVK